MEIEQLKSATTEDQMEMMLMMDKLPPFFSSSSSSSSSSYNDHHQHQPHVPDITLTHEFLSSNNNNNIEFINNIHSPTPPPPTNISFNNNVNSYQLEQQWTDFITSTNIDSINYSSTTPSSFNNIMATQKRSSSVAAMREMIFRIAVMQPVHIDPESVKPPKRRNVKISKDPQSVAARHRRERISERIRILQRLVPGGTKMDTASMLDEAIHYVKFLKTQVQSLERAQASSSNVNRAMSATGIGFPVAMSTGSYHHQQHLHQPASAPHNVHHYGDANY